MNYIVLDMEWNQAASYAEMIKDPVFLTGEIIQIGAVKLNDAFEPVDFFNGRVVPNYYTELHPQVAEVTKLTQQDLRRGKHFLDVFAAFCEWCGTDFAFFIWGTEDLRILRKNMELYDIDTSFMPLCYNLQNIFAAQVSHDTRQYKLSRALACFNEVPFDAHDALNDAKSTTLLCNHFDLVKGLSEYKELVEHKDGVVESYEFNEGFTDISDALNDDYVVSFECPNCGDIIWGDNWVRKSDTTTLFSTGMCSDGQEYLIKLKFRPIANNRVSCKRFVYELTDELRAEYRDCVQQAAAWSKYVIPAYSF